MSLDFYLNTPHQKRIKEGSGIFIRENGMTKEITAEEWDQEFPGSVPVVVKHDDKTNEVFHANITHNLVAMAKQAGIYECLWRPDENGFENASDIVARLKTGIELMESNPVFFKQFNASNGWGTYEDFLHFTKDVVTACTEYPGAKIKVWI